jgi:hypothetical protein
MKLDKLLDVHDIRYLSPAEEGRFGLPVGNGDLTAMLWTPPGRLRLAINKSNTYDDAPELPVSDWHWSPAMEEKATALVACAALSIQNSLPLFETIYLDDFEARVHLREGYVSVGARAPMCATQVRTYVGRDPDVLIVDYEEIADEAVEREIVLSRWGSRRLHHWYMQLNRDTSVGLDGTIVGCDAERVWVEQQLRTLSFAVAARFVGASVQTDCPNSHTVRIVTGRAQELKGQLYLAVVTSEEHHDPLAEARRRVDEAVTLGIEALVERNAKRWADFWSRSFVRLPDAYLENLYYFSLYQLGASSTGPYPPKYHGGLWLWNHDARQWGSFYHWNQQQLVWPVHAAGHPELAQGYYEMRFKGLDEARHTAQKIHGIKGAFYTDVCDRLGRNATNGNMEGHLDHNLTPGSQIAMDFWRHYIYTRDTNFLRERAYPVMREAARFYLNYMVQDANGVYHVPASTGYEGHLRVQDCVADISIIRNSFAACIEAAQLLDVDVDLRAALRQVLDNLADYVLIEEDGQPVVATGIAIADEPSVSYEVGRPFKKGEPLFYSGFWLPMAPAFPSGAVGLADEGTELLEAVRNGVRIVGPTSAGGWIPSAIFAARLGMGDEALAWLGHYVQFCQTLPQGFMQEGVWNDGSTDIWVTCDPWLIRDGVRTEEKARLLRRYFDTTSPECNANVMTAIQEMLLQSYDGIIHVFPSMPGAWGDTAFRLHAVGGFVVTAERRRGKVLHVQVESKCGRMCRVANPWSDFHVAVQQEGIGEPLVVTADGVVEFPTAPGGTYLVRLAGQVGKPLPAVEWEMPAAGPRQGYDRQLGIPRYF